MKKLFFGTILLALVLVRPFPTMAGVEIRINIPLPPHVLFAEPPEVIVLPGTNVYVSPDIDVDLFFWNGWWWRPWAGRWYRSHYYNREWIYYSNVPRFYFDIDPDWRRYYREHNWYGHRWDYERIPHQQLQRNWKSWQNDRRWERQGTWGVQNYQPRPQQQIREQRQQQYQQRPDVQKQRQPQVQQPRQQTHVQQPRQEPRVQPPQRQPEVQQSRQPQERGQQPQRREQMPQAKTPQNSQPQGKPERVR